MWRPPIYVVRFKIRDGFFRCSAQFIGRDPKSALTRSRYGYAANDPTLFTDPSGLDWGWNPLEDIGQAWNDTGGKVVNYVSTHTVGACVNVSAGVVLWGTANACLASVGGHPTLIGTAGGGASSPTASLTGGLLVSNASDPSQLTGWFGTVGASGDLGLPVGDDFSIGHDSCGNTIWENQTMLGVGIDLPIPGEVHVGETYTWLASW